MTQFFLAIAVFLTAHVAPAATGLRGFLIARLGRRSYLLGYSLVSLACIAWVIAAALAAPSVELWAPSRTGALVPLAAMLPACILLAGGLWQPSPLSVTFRSGLPDPRKAGLVARIRHPFLWAFFLWSASHLVANGDLVSVILFASLALVSLAGMKRLEERARTRLPEADYEAAAALSSGGPLARFNGLAKGRALAEGLAGLLLYEALLHLHGPVIGIDPLIWLR
mgnify:CR=1 FL=1